MLVLGPHVGDTGLVSPEHVVVRERVPEEVRPLEATLQGFVLVGMTHERRDAREVRVHRVADGHTLPLERPVVVADPVAGIFGIDEREAECTDPLLRCEVDRLAPAARHPHRWMRLLARLGNDVTGRHRDVLAVDAGERLLGHAPHRDAQPLLPHLPLLDRVDEEAAELRLGRRLARAEVDAPARDQVEGGDALGDAGRVIERRWRLDDAVAETHLLGALRHRGQEDLRRARVAVLLEEVVLDLPAVLDAELVGELALLQRVLQQRVLGVLVPRTRELVLVKLLQQRVAAGAPIEGVLDLAQCQRKVLLASGTERFGEAAVP